MRLQELENLLEPEPTLDRGVPLDKGLYAYGTRWDVHEEYAKVHPAVRAALRQENERAHCWRGPAISFCLLGLIALLLAYSHLKGQPNASTGGSS